MPDLTSTNPFANPISHDQQIENVKMKVRDEAGTDIDGSDGVVEFRKASGLPTPFHCSFRLIASISPTTR